MNITSGRVAPTNTLLHQRRWRRFRGSILPLLILHYKKGCKYGLDRCGDKISEVVCIVVL
ncbi:hypothetical protein [Tengunoibacter tsumagoiensis]|uniref:hypothetical protein n=1 Tax=Tengunoibacter tsumagoiensis TaxID=2014871 RepID=UPI000F81CA42|nr:hypothetical protein [Tengunoibacter tsumagoiensis]